MKKKSPKISNQLNKNQKLFKKVSIEIAKLLQKYKVELVPEMIIGQNKIEPRISLKLKS